MCPGYGMPRLVSLMTATISATIIAVLGVPLAYVLARSRTRPGRGGRPGGPAAAGPAPARQRDLATGPGRSRTPRSDASLADGSPTAWPASCWPRRSWPPLLGDRRPQRLCRRRPGARRGRRHARAVATCQVLQDQPPAGLLGHRRRPPAVVAAGLRRVRGHHHPGLPPVLAAGLHLRPVLEHRAVGHPRTLVPGRGHGGGGGPGCHARRPPVGRPRRRPMADDVAAEAPAERSTRPLAFELHRTPRHLPLWKWRCPNRLDVWQSSGRRGRASPPPCGPWPACWGRAQTPWCWGASRWRPWRSTDGASATFPRSRASCHTARSGSSSR